MNDIAKETQEQKEAAELRYRLVKSCTCACPISAHAYGEGRCDFCGCKAFVPAKGEE